MFGDFVFEDETSTNPLIFSYNLSTLATALLNPYVTIALTIPATLYTLISLWTGSVSTMILIMFTVMGIVILLACAIQIAKHFEIGHQSSRRWIPLDKEVVIITGGSSGIGFECAKRLADLGLKVAIWDIQKPISDDYNHSTHVK
jgi:hypothetical protein